jgi:hypothetical protein
MASQANISQKAKKSSKEDYKRIILCCDGTWQAQDKGFRSVPSNVVKISRAISRHEIVNGREIEQIVYYQTGEISWLARQFYGTSRGSYLEMFLLSDQCFNQRTCGSVRNISYCA